MNKFLNVLSCGLAVSSLCYALNPTYNVLIFSFLISCAVVVLGLWLEYKIKTNGNAFINKIFYYLSKKDKDYNFESVHCTYSCLNNNSYKCRRAVEICSNRNDLRGIGDHFRWSAPSSMASIEPVDSKHSIKGKHQEDD